MKIEEAKEAIKASSKAMTDINVINSFGHIPCKQAIPVNDVINIIDQIELDQPKPLVPQCVIDWVNDSRESDYFFEEWFDRDYQPKEVRKWLNLKNKRQADINALALVTLIVNGPDSVKVEKEKLYTVEIPNPNNRVVHRHIMLVKMSDGRITLIELIDSHVNLREDVKLTEQEIRKDYDWAFRWAKEVTE